MNKVYTRFARYHASLDVLEYFPVSSAALQDGG
jgi:hypothetical protein